MTQLRTWNWRGCTALPRSRRLGLHAATVAAAMSSEAISQAQQHKSVVVISAGDDCQCIRFDGVDEAVRVVDSP